MWKFGIYACSDSIFIGGEPGRWIGVHIDLPWMKCCKEYGVPSRIYLHWWPGKCKSFDLPLKNPYEDIWNFGSSGAKMTKIVRRCAVCNAVIDRDDPLYFLHAKNEVRQPNGIQRDIGTSTALLCIRHGRMATMGSIRANYVE